MNGREATELRDALQKLERGPGGGWRQTLAGNEPGGAPTRSIEERTRSVEIWLESWITPAMKAAVARYWRPARPMASRRAYALVTPARKFLEQIQEGREREARLEESAPYWAGYYRVIAENAVARVYELEAAAAGKVSRS